MVRDRNNPKKQNYVSSLKNPIRMMLDNRPAGEMNYITKLTKVSSAWLMIRTPPTEKNPTERPIYIANLNNVFFAWRMILRNPENLNHTANLKKSMRTIRDNDTAEGDELYRESK